MNRCCFNNSNILLRKAFSVPFFADINKALEKVCKEKLIWKRFEIYQTISWFGAFLLTLSLNNITKLVSMSIKLVSMSIKLVIEIIIKSTFIKFSPTILKEIHTLSSISSLTPYWKQLTGSPCTWDESRKSNANKIKEPINKNFFSLLDQAS